MSTQNALSQFSPEARLVFEEGSRQEAQRFNHHYIGTEHILLALLSREGRTRRLFSQMELDLAKIKQGVELLIGRGDRPPVTEEILLTPRAKKVRELAVDEARRINSDTVEEEHVALALMREEEGVAAGVLKSLGCSLHAMRTSLYLNPYLFLSPEERAGLLVKVQEQFKEDRIRLGLANQALSRAQEVLINAQKEHAEASRIAGATMQKIAQLERAVNLEPQPAP